MSPNNIRVGTSGFSYKDWLGNFYPQFCPQADFLKFYSSRFNTVEIDSTWYRIPAVETVKKWASVTPNDFVFTAKFPRAVTHEGSLEDRLRSAGAFVKVMASLGEKLGPLLLQFPYSFNPERFDDLRSLIGGLPETGRFAVEFRNRKWLEVPKMIDLLTERNMALCMVDHPWMPRIDIKTADFLYLRFLGDREKIENDFSYIRIDRTDQLREWKNLIAAYIQEGTDIYAYFNNHFSGHSPTSASQFVNILSE